MSSKSDKELFFAMLSPNPGERILDVGAGNGLVARRVLAVSNGAEVYAIDPDEKRVAYMKSHSPELKSCAGGSESIPFPDSFFDKVYTTMTVHHFADLDKALWEFDRVLKDGGFLVVLDVDPRYGRGRVLQFLENGILRKHASFMEEGQLVEKVNATGSLRVLQSVRSKSGYFVRCAKNGSG
jgi:ubiquinone/menaquinone biosynthesis C-methylase UbiE